MEPQPDSHKQNGPALCDQSESCQSTKRPTLPRPNPVPFFLFKLGAGHAMWYSKNKLADMISRVAIFVAMVVINQRSLSSKYVNFFL